jgi:quinol monooxygenase YgiN
MAKLGLLARIEARTGKEDEVESLLSGALPLARAETATRTWYAFRLGPSSFGIFDTFDDEAGRQAHLDGEIARALMGKADELLAKPPQIDKVDVLAAK